MKTTYEVMSLAERRAARVLGLYPMDVCPCGRTLTADGRCCASGAAPMACDLPYVDLHAQSVRGGDALHA